MISEFYNEDCMTGMARYPDKFFDLAIVHPSRRTDQQGLYYNGEIVAYSYSDAIKELFQINEIPTGFAVNTDHEAFGYSVVNANGVQHIYEMNPVAFYDAFMNLE